MTPTEQDKELDETLKSIIESYAPYYKEQGLNTNYSVFQSHKAKIKQLITADRKHVALEARIEENESWYALGRMIDPREFVAEIGGLELKLQEEV